MENQDKKRQKVAKALAQEFNAIFVPFQQIFIEACKKAPLDYRIWDGVHPRPAGHELMAMRWLKVVSKKIVLRFGFLIINFLNFFLVILRLFCSSYMV